jgi:DNA polymerase-3 subunit delta'
MPWDEIAGQERAVRLLRTALARGQPHHAYLVAGPRGVGKELLARLFAQAANCEAAEPDRPCGTCAACAAIARGVHPDVTWVLPQSEAVARGQIAKADLEGAPSKEIRVDEVRALSRRLSLAAARGRRKVAVLAPAEALNERAQNALLKTLEEPPPATTFLLVSEQPDALLATVRSRCARLQLAPLPPELIAARLGARGISEVEARERALRAEGSLGRALAIESGELARQHALVRAFEAAVAAPDEIETLDIAELQGDRDAALELALVVQAWTRDLLVQASGGAIDAVELRELCESVAQRTPRFALLEQAELCAEAIEALEQNGNGRLQLERLILRVREVRGA